MSPAMIRSFQSDAQKLEEKAKKKEDQISKWKDGSEKEKFKKLQEVDDIYCKALESKIALLDKM